MLKTGVPSRAAIALIVAFALGYGVSSRNKLRADDATARPFLILSELPIAASAYQPKAAELVRKGIPDKFGREEWAAIVLTHEFHQHVGIYTVLGAKMGVRAREALNAPTRNVMVEMETGPDQPMACVADGVQASIGSTYAQNLIAMPTVNKPVVSGVFTYRDASVRVRLKEEYQARIERFIVEALMKYPALSPQYFATIEDASYSVWAEFDRKEIFDVTPL